MTSVFAGDANGNNEQFEAALPPQPLGGTNVYYVVCQFEGYRYQSPDYTVQGYVGYPSEWRSPVTNSVQTNTFGAAGFYKLTVAGGSGSGLAYTNGEIVAVNANALAGKAFDRWTGATQYVASVTASNTVVTMPDTDISLTATYVDLSYTLSVVNGTGSGSTYTNGQQVTVVADVLAGKIFDRWTGDTLHLANVAASNTVVTMPPASIAITATYLDVYALSVTSGTGSGTYTNGQKVAINANAPSGSQRFDRWLGDTQAVASVTASNTVVTMPATNVFLTAAYINIYTLSVTNGVGGGTSYTNGQQVSVTANVLGGKIFDRWTGATQYVASVTASNTVVTMPASNILITATYLDVYLLSVVNGTGGGTYTNGQQVAVAANAPALGKTFDRWTGATQAVANVTSSNTVVSMPPSNILITATYASIQYTLSVTSGTGSGTTYTNGQQVAVAANPPPDGQRFDRWTGATQIVASVTSSNTVATMPAANVAITATYINIYTLSVTNGTGSGSYTNGQVVALTADVLAGKNFDRWIGDTQTVASVTSSNTTVRMPSSPVTLTATYFNVYTLSVTNGTGSGSYTNGQQVAVTANVLAGKIFDRWTGATQCVANVTSSNTVVTMPANDIVITANYSDVFVLTVNGGAGGGSYTNQQQVAVTAGTPATGKAFDCWTGATQAVANVNSSSTSVTMPGSNIVITATYTNILYTLTVISGNNSGTYTNGQRVTVTADAVSGRTFVLWTGATQYVGNATSQTTVVTMPASDISIAAIYSLLTFTPTENRILQFDDYVLTNNLPTPTWRHVGPVITGSILKKGLKDGTNHFHRTGWFLQACRTGTAKGLGALRIVPPVEVAVPPLSATNFAANLQNTLSARIESPILAEGIGTVYFEAINNAEATEVTVEYATNMVSTSDVWEFTPLNPASLTNGYDYNWITLATLQLNALTPTDFTRYCNLLNYRQPAKLRIRRSGTLPPGDLLIDEALTVIDNIRVSAPPSDVVIYKTDCSFEPGYPAVNSGISIRCYVSNVDTNAPTVSRSVDVYYRWRYLDQASNAWQSLTMELTDVGDGQGNNERFEKTLPVQTQVGDLEYYFVCNFDGSRYQSLDYTGTGVAGILVGNKMVYPYASEWLSPRRLRGGASEPDGREFYTRLRPFKSQYGALYVVAADTNAFPQPIEMSLVGDDQWRGMVPIRSAGVTNISWYFKGTNAYVLGAEAYSTNVANWAEQAQAGGVGRVPYGGTCVQTNAPRRINVTASGGGYVQMVFNTSTLDYMTSRAEYQNFNAWPAPATNFTDTSGQDPRTRRLNTFDSDNWPVNTDRPYNESIVAYVAKTNVYSRDPFPTPAFWMAGSAAYVSERLWADYNNHPLGVNDFRNLALRLKGGDGVLGLGYVYNTVASRPDGLKQITFKCRLGQTASNYDVAYNRDEFTRTNYLVKVDAEALAGMSPEQPSVSLIGYFRDPQNFYEFRMTQIPQSASSDQRVSLQLYKWTNGVPVLLRENKPTLSFVMTTRMLMDMRFGNTSPTSTRIRCQFAAVGEVLDYTDTAAPYIQNGTYGFLSSDCVAGFSNVRTQGTLSDATPDVSTNIVTVLNSVDPGFSDKLAPWYTPAGRFEAKVSSPSGIYSVKPTQKLGIYLQNSDYSVTNAPAAPGSPLWIKAQEVTVPGFDYTSMTVPVYNWKSQFVMLQVMGGLADVAVDELEVTSWHAKAELSDSGHAFSADWLATEAWVVSNAVPELKVVQLDLSRANPDYDQVVRSPVSDTGMGLMEFDYRVLRAPAKITVQYAYKRDYSASSSWSNMVSYVSSGTSGWAHVSAYLGNTNAGVFRVINERGVGYSNSLVEINNAITWDEPAVGDSSWTVYNAKVTGLDKMRVALDNSPGCFLNNSQTIDAAPIQDQSEPYVRSPVLPAGLGRLTFNARAYTNTQSTTVYVFASTNGWNAASNQWIQLAKFDNISNTLYQSFSYDELYGKKYTAVRLMTKTPPGPNVGRACLDEIAVSEPTFPGFDIGNVRVLCEDNNGTYSSTRFQPLISDDVGVEAQIVNKQLSPSNIQMSVTYYIGTNVWGVNHWPAGQTVTKPMFPTDENPLIYRTSPTNDIPVQELDQVVQYRVSASYLGGIPLHVDQETFDNPSWYEPVDLNKTYVARGWSPYYIVYGVPVGAVWINEVNATDYSGGIGEFRYIEIAVPVGVDLAGWKVDVVTTEAYTTRTIAIPPGKGLTAADAFTTNGYAFFVIGEDSIPAVTNCNYAYLGLTDAMPRIMPGGLRLRRPRGMIDQAITYAYTTNFGGAFSGPLWAANDPQKRFVYVGLEYSGGSLSVTNGVGASTNDWGFPLTWTPGWVNVGQAVSPASVIMSGVSNVLVTSLLNVGRGTQNDKRTTYLSFKAPKGSSTNIIYVADPWYRISSVKANQLEQLAMGGPTNYTLNLTDLQTNFTVDVTIGLRDDVSGLAVDPTILSWLVGFGDAPLVPSLYNGRALTLTELYWLNANPTASNRLEYLVTSFSVDSVSNAHAAVKLTLNDQNVTNLQGGSVMKIETKNKPTDAQWELLTQYSLNTASFDTNHTSRMTILNAFNYRIVGWDLRSVFSRGIIDREDPRVSAHPLITLP
jgi:hypothetical protein